MIVSVITNREISGDTSGSGPLALARSWALTGGFPTAATNQIAGTSPGTSGTNGTSLAGNRPPPLSLAKSPTPTKTVGANGASGAKAMVTPLSLTGEKTLPGTTMAATAAEPEKEEVRETHLYTRKHACTHTYTQTHTLLHTYTLGGADGAG